MLETIVLSAAMALSGVVGVAPGTLPAAALKADVAHPVIVHIVSRDRTLTVKAGQKGLLYSLTSKEGKVLIADATPARFAELQPEMYQQIRQYIAVEADASKAISSSRPEVLAAIDER